MGLQNREGGNFITIYDGKMCQRVPEGTAGAIQRTNKIGKVVWEKFYDSFTGKLVGISTKESVSYGKQWIFDFKDNAEVYHLQLPYSNNFAKALLKMLPNIDLTKEFKVSPSSKEVDGKKQSSLFVNQDGNTIKHAYTRENLNGMPEMEQITVKGVQQWDDTKQLVFLQNMVDTIVLPKLGQTAQTGSVSLPGEELVADENPF